MSAEHPPDPTAGSGQDRDLARFVTFLDAVVAIAITLLVLPLAEMTVDLGADQSVAELLDEHQAELLAFLLSFVVIARLWYSQHATVRILVGFDGWVFTILSAWALTIVFLPFPTSLVAEAPDDWLTKTLYIGTMAANLLVLAVLDVVMIRRPELRAPGRRPDLAAALINAALMGLALAISLAIPATSYFPLLLVALDDPIERLLSVGRS